MTNDYLFTGREKDEDAGLYYYRARYYDARVGRFVRKDPVGFEGGVNFYAYVAGNPVNRIDPLGLMVLIDPPPINEPKVDTSVITKGIGKWGCNAKCPVIKIDPKACCPTYTFGMGYGSSPAEACSNAEYIARNATPCGCRTRHCRRNAFKLN